MSADIEARLRASLHAYADLVDDPGDDVALPVPPTAGSVVRRWRTSLLVAAAVVTIAGGVWTTAAVVDPGSSETVAGADSAGSAPGGDDREETLGGPEDSGTGSEDPVTDSVESAEAAAIPAEVGATVPFELYTHCGILGAYLDGVWFAAETPLVRGGPLVPGGANPPEGWGNPYQPGTLTLETAETAVFRDDLGHEVRMRSAPDEAPPPCD
jgi:hypothetical protein